MSKIDARFAELRRAERKAFVPFVTAGDPSLEFTSKLIGELVDRGSSIVEIGIPYSDPIADGPVIQASYTRALAKHIQVRQIFEMVAGISSKLVAPLVTMVSYAIIYRHGPERYVAEAKAAGVSGAIVPDLPIDEAEKLAELCRREDFSLILLVTPTTPRERAVRIANASSGFLYYVSVAGITGERTQLPQELVENVGWLRSQTSTPICVGFGISTPAHVKMVSTVADGVIVGSAIVRRVAAAAEGKHETLVKEIGDYAASLIAECG